MIEICSGALEVGADDGLRQSGAAKLSCSNAGAFGSGVRVQWCTAS